MTESTVAVVGSGIVGTTFAYLLSARGHDVAIFEKGADYPYPHVEPFVEETQYLHENPAYRLPEDLKNVTRSGDYARDLNQDFWSVAGGATTRWWGLTPRMVPGDFNTRTLHGYGDDWPLAYADLEPWYCEAESMLGVSGTDDDNPFAPPRSRPHVLPPFELGYDDLRFAERLRRHDLVLHTTPQARTRRSYEDRPVCFNFGTCDVCPVGARYSPNYHLQQAVATGRCRMHTGVSVRRIVVDRQGRARALVVRDNAGGKDREHAARLIIVAANAVESARLLLLSTDERHPDGLGNDHEQVGRNLTFHHGWIGKLRFAERLRTARFGGVTGQCQQFVDGPERGRRGAIKIDLPFNHGPSPFLSRSREDWRNAADVLADLDEQQHWCDFRAHAEAIPGPEKSVSLSDRRDRFGDPFAHVDYGLNDRDHDTAEFARELFDRFAAALGAERASFSRRYSSCAHHHGTCRMGVDPGTSVVDPYGRVHGFSNLFVGGGSQFVSSGSSNPTLTMVALAIRAAAYVEESLSSPS